MPTTYAAHLAGLREQGGIFIGDALDELRKLPSGIVQTCVTSPPYWGLRDYGTRRWFGGDPSCEHGDLVEIGPHHPGQVPQTNKGERTVAVAEGQTATTSTCSRCGAWYGQLGLEPTPDAYVQHMVEVFREVRRVLRDDGTLWLNLGDSYAGYHGNSRVPDRAAPSNKPGYVENMRSSTVGVSGLKSKDLVGIPWMVAFALRADGWYLRSDIVWAKGNVMPESVQDRPTKAHEYVFLLTKNASYFYDAEAVKEASVTTHMPGSKVMETFHYGAGNGGNSGLNNLLDRYKEEGLPSTRNRRSVWHINPKPYKGAHFATFPEELPEVCIRAGTSEKGACPKCGAPWERSIERTGDRVGNGVSNGIAPENHANGVRTVDPSGAGGNVLAVTPRKFVGWKPSCECEAGDPCPCVVLDPFSGSGTTLAVAKYLRRDYLGIEINAEYHKLIQERLRPAEDLESERQGFDASWELEQE